MLTKIGRMILLVSLMNFNRVVIYVSKNVDKLPISQKCALTIEEAAEYSNIGQNKLSSLLKIPNCTFVLYVGKKKLVKRKEFEDFISRSVEI